MKQRKLWFFPKRITEVSVSYLNTNRIIKLRKKHLFITQLFCVRWQVFELRAAAGMDANSTLGIVIAFCSLELKELLI